MNDPIAFYLSVRQSDVFRHWAESRWDKFVRPCKGTKGLRFMAPFTFTLSHRNGFEVEVEFAFDGHRERLVLTLDEHGAFISKDAQQEEWAIGSDVDNQSKKKG